MAPQLRQTLVSSPRISQVTQPHRINHYSGCITTPDDLQLLGQLPFQIAHANFLDRQRNEQSIPHEQYGPEPLRPTFTIIPLLPTQISAKTSLETQFRPWIPIRRKLSV